MCRAHFGGLYTVCVRVCVCTCVCVYVCVCTCVCPFSQVVHLDDYHGLLQYIDESSLTSDLGGSLVYDHQEWVKYRLVSARAAAALWG